MNEWGGFLLVRFRTVDASKQTERRQLATRGEAAGRAARGSASGFTTARSGMFDDLKRTSLRFRTNSP